MASADPLIVSAEGRRKRADMRMRQEKRGPAPLASCEDTTVDQSVEQSLEECDPTAGRAGVGWGRQQGLTQPRIHVSVAASPGSRHSTPECAILHDTLRENAAELHCSTDDTLEAARRRSSASSVGSELILPVSGRSSRVSSLCSNVSGRRSMSPYRTLLETSFCGSKPMPTPSDQPPLAVSPNGNTSPISMLRDCVSPVRELRACTLPIGQAALGFRGEDMRKTSLDNVRKIRQQSPSPRRSSLGKFLNDAKRELVGRSRARTKSSDQKTLNNKSPIVDTFRQSYQRQLADDNESEHSTLTNNSPTIQPCLDEELNKIEFKFYEPAKGQQPITPADEDIFEPRSSEIDMNSSHQNHDSREFAFVENSNSDQSKRAVLQSRQIEPASITSLENNPNDVEKFKESDREQALVSSHQASREHTINKNPIEDVFTVGKQKHGLPDGMDKKRSRVIAEMNSSASDRNSSASEESISPNKIVPIDTALLEKTNGAQDVAQKPTESVTLFEECEEDDLPYVPTTLPQERPLQHSMVPISHRGAGLQIMVSVDRPRCMQSVTPVDLESYIQLSPKQTAPKVRILLPQDSLNLIKTPKRMKMKSWKQFAEDGVQSYGRSNRAGDPITTTVSTANETRVTVIRPDRSEPDYFHQKVRNWTPLDEEPQEPRKPKRFIPGKESKLVQEKNAMIESSAGNSIPQWHANFGENNTTNLSPNRKLSSSSRTTSPRNLPFFSQRETTGRCSVCACGLSPSSSCSDQDNLNVSRYQQMRRSPVQMDEYRHRQDEIRSQAESATMQVHQQTAKLADVMQDATRSYFHQIQENAERKTSLGNELTVDTGFRSRASSCGSGKSRSPSPHKMLLETSFCGTRTGQQPEEVQQVENLLELTHLRNEAGSACTDTDSGGPRSLDACPCHCHVEKPHWQTSSDPQRKPDDDNISVDSSSCGSKSSSEPATCKDRAQRNLPEEFPTDDSRLLPGPSVPFDTDLGVHSIPGSTAHSHASSSTASTPGEVYNG